MDKVDYRKKYHELYSPPADKVQEITVPKLQFAMIDGTGSEGGPETSPEFQNAVGALYGLTYTVKFSRKKAGQGPDYTVGPLEGLWWMKDDSVFDASRPQDWQWTMMIMQPEFITHEEFAAAVQVLKLKKPNPALNKLRLETFDEGKSVQIMHVGPYAEEARSIQKLTDYCTEHGYKSRGKHHEIYLGDPRRAKPDKLRTVLRHPIAP